MLNKFIWILYFVLLIRIDVYTGKFHFGIQTFPCWQTLIKKKTKKCSTKMWFHWIYFWKIILLQNTFSMLSFIVSIFKDVVHNELNQIQYNNNVAIQHQCTSIDFQIKYRKLNEILHQFASTFFRNLIAKFPLLFGNGWRGKSYKCRSFRKKKCTGRDTDWA